MTEGGTPWRAGAKRRAPGPRPRGGPARGPPPGVLAPGPLATSGRGVAIRLPVPEVVHEARSAQNVRYVVALDDGARVEAVLYRGDTLCVSCQVGCAVRCPFCASGHGG